MAELTPADTGIPKVDRNIIAVDDQSQVAADQYNKIAQAAIQNSRTGPRWTVKFNTINGGSYPVTMVLDTDFTIKSHWGSGSGIVTMEKTAANTYEITLVTPQTDLLNNEEVITIGPLSWAPHAWSSDAADDLHAKVTDVTGLVITITTESPRANPSDLGDNSGVVFPVEFAIP